MEKIGARILVSFEPGAGNNSFRIKEHVDGNILERIVHNLSDYPSNKLLKYYKVLGVADGQDFMHCLYLGSKYAKNFEHNVAGYTVAASDKKGCTMKVIFYKLKKKA
ncbi:MAG: hypothetical protein HYY86_03130 [Candidatus Harrisonbacteria bacterium]|nr:hypothetical protein [Candidatus Harrisonbacteria bacterium]